MIRDLSASLSVLGRCQLMEVSRAGYYRWLDRVAGSVVDSDTILIERIRALHRRWYGILGFRRVHRLLELDGVGVPQRRIRRLMRLHGLFGRPGGRRSRYRGSPRETVAEDRLQRRFHADRPNHKWVSDITEFRTLEGKLYLCQVRDLYDGVIVGWSLDMRQTSQLVIQAAAMAIRTRVAPKEIIFHSDRGTQYTSRTLSQWLKEHGLTARMGAVGRRADNASAESFFGQLKRELQGMCRNDTRKQATIRIHDYIVGLYNVMRRVAHAESGIREIILADTLETQSLDNPKELFLENP